MSQENRLEKTNRINLLFDFYELLLTEKQQMFLKYYFHDDYSLGEIAAEFNISRQAVYEHIKRAEQVLEMYEQKLGLMDKHYQRAKELEKLKTALHQSGLDEHHQAEALEIMDHLESIDRL
ncbi:MULTISPECIES: YlxM family DNA-binding protein [Paenibacillus]|uniref:YlxM family DNA-binding protein n=1 Tax=Paenibacillus TaxID=44249 RepID=UPI0003679218|nr:MULTISPECIES: YlxM family DNA-binding protein [Paenibacillus]